MLFLILLLFVCMVVVLPFSYILYLMLPYTDAPKKIILFPKERLALQLIAWYPIVSLALILLSGEMVYLMGMGPYMFKSLAAGLLFTGGSMLLCMMGAATGRSVYKGSWLGIALFILNTLCGCTYGIAMIVMLNGSD